MRLLIRCLWVIFSAICAPAFATDADRVLVVQNAGSAVSMSIAQDYIHRRGIHHVVTLHCKDSAALGKEVVTDPAVNFVIGTKAETIDLPAYVKEIEAPIRAYLAGHSGIDFIVLTKGIPIRIDGAAQAGGIDRFSVDSRLAALDYDKLPGTVPVEFAEPLYDQWYVEHLHRHFTARIWANRYWNSQERFSHARFGGYLVTRLDGYTEADAKALIARSLQAEQVAHAGKMPSGSILLDISPTVGFTDVARQPYDLLSERKSSGEPVKITSESAHLGDFNSGMELAAKTLGTRGIQVELDKSERFVDKRSGLMGYISWGSNDAHFTALAYHSIGFAPGAIGETAVSTSARTFLPAKGGQSLIADLVAQGITGVKGYVEEPLVQGVAAPSILLDRYTQGWTLAESFYAASALVGWEDVVIGDPLCVAFPARKVAEAR